MSIDFAPIPPVTTYVNGGAALTTAALLSAYPAGVAVMGMYARVSDLFGSVDDIMRCRFDGANYNWVPQRESCTGTTAATGGVVNFTPLVTTPTLIFTASALVSNMNINMLTQNAYNGMPAELVAPPTLGLGVYTMTITNLIGTNPSFGAGQTRRLRYGPGGWYLLP